MPDFFRPASEPAATIYDAFVKESQMRNGREPDVWMTAERNAVHEAACKVAASFSLNKPTLSEVEAAEITAAGHSDYGKKWAYGVVDAMNRTT